MSSADLDASLNRTLHLLDHRTKHLAHRRAEHTLRQIHDAVHGQRTVQRTRENQRESETTSNQAAIEPSNHSTIQPGGGVSEGVVWGVSVRFEGWLGRVPTREAS